MSYCHSLPNPRARRLSLQEDLCGAFSPARFAKSRLPVQVARLRDETVSQKLPACLDMLIMFPGGRIVLPEPYKSNASIVTFLAEALAFEDVLLPGWRDERYLYLTVDCRDVPVGRTHRNAGWHFDGMQGTRYPVKLPVCHQYLVSSRLPTEFSAEPTDASGLSELDDNWFESLGAQIAPSAPIWTPEPGEIVAMSAYQLHRSPLAGPGQDGLRSFFRLDVSCKQQDRLGNTVNPDLPATFRYVVRDLPLGLGRPPNDAGWSGRNASTGA